MAAGTLNPQAQEQLGRVFDLLDVSFTSRYQVTGGFCPISPEAVSTCRTN